MHLVLIIRLSVSLEHKNGIRYNAYGALSTTFPTMHISTDRK